MRNPFDWDYLTAPLWATPTWGPFSIAFLVVFGLGLIVSLVIYYDIGGRLRQDRLLYPVLQRATAISSTIFALGLFFFMFRLLRVNAFGLHMRLWSYLFTLAILAEVGYYAHYFRTVYPARRKALEAERIKQRYLEPAFAGGGARRRRAKGKRRR